MFREELPMFPHPQADQAVGQQGAEFRPALTGRHVGGWQGVGPFHAQGTSSGLWHRKADSTPEVGQCWQPSFEVKERKGNKILVGTISKDYPRLKTRS